MGVSARSRVVCAVHENSRGRRISPGSLTIFVVVVVLAGVLGRIARWAVHGVGLRWFDRVLGALFGFFRGVVVSAVIVMALAALRAAVGTLQQSRIAPFLLVTGRALIWAAPAELRQRFRDGWNLLRTVPEHVPVKAHDR